MMFRLWRNDVAYANDVLLTQNDVFAYTNIAVAGFACDLYE